MYRFVDFLSVHICTNLWKTRGQCVSLTMAETILSTKDKVILCEMKQRSRFLFNSLEPKLKDHIK